MTGAPAAASDIVADAVARLREDEPRLGRLIAAIDFKKRLVAALGIEAAFAAAAPHLRVPDTAALRPRRVVSLRSVVEGAPGFRELWPNAQPVEHRPPCVIGPGDHRTLRCVGRSGFVGRIDDVLVRGRAITLMRGDEAIVDYENDELERFTDSPEKDACILHADGATYWTMDPAPGAPVVEYAEALHLAGGYSHDWGHWLEEFLPRLAMAEMAGLPDDLPLLVDELMPATHREALALLRPRTPLVTVPHLAAVRVARLWCASNPVYHGWYPLDFPLSWEAQLAHPDWWARLIRGVKSLAGPALDVPTGVRRVFFARRPTRKKVLRNAQAIEAMARERGFEVVYPEDLSFVEQMRMGAQADYILAPDGSNGLLCYYAKPGAKVCFLNNPNTLPLVGLNGMLEAVGAEFTVVSGPVEGSPDPDLFWSDYRIDETVFADFLAQWLPQEGNARA